MSNKEQNEVNLKKVDPKKVVVEIRSKEWAPENHPDKEDDIKNIVCEAYNGTRKARAAGQTISVDDVIVDWKLADAEIAARYACDEVLVYVHMPQNTAFIPDVLTIQNGMKLLFPGFKKHFGVQAVRDGESSYIPSDKPVSPRRQNYGVVSIADMMRT